MKKIISIIFVVCAFTLVGCATKSQPTTDTTSVHKPHKKHHTKKICPRPGKFGIEKNTHDFAK